MKTFKFPISFKKYCKKNLLFLGRHYSWNKVYNKCLEHYGHEIVNQSIKELENEGKISKVIK